MLIFTSISFAEENQIQVKVNVAAMQELTVKEGIGVSFSYPWKGMEDGEALIFRNVGKLNIKSNVDWALSIGSIERYSELEIYISPANAGKWQRIDGFNSLVSGNYGNMDISWDIKIVKSRTNYTLNSRNTYSDNRTNNYNNDIRTVNMMFTLTQL